LFTFIVRRILLLPLIFIGVTLFIVLLMQLLSPAERAAGFVSSEAQLRNLPAIIEQYGLDRPWYVQYWNWLTQAAQGNLGLLPSNQSACSDDDPGAPPQHHRTRRADDHSDDRPGYLAGDGRGP
jgi:peptide/nickel transport system permease protein